MPSGACVVEYRGKRGLVFRIKYRDATGRQVKETVGAERDGITRKHAEQALQDRLSDVRRRDYERPRQTTFASYAAAWFSEGETKRRWKPTTVAQYVSTRGRLVKAFGPMPLDAIRPRHIAAYIAEQSKTLGASTVGRDASVLAAIFNSARREELVESNPAERAERPKLPPFRPAILDPHEVPRVAKAFREPQARLVFLTLVLTAIRRSELQELRWADVDLVENVLRVRDSKSESGRRAIALPTSLAEALWQWRRRSNYNGEGERVFCHQQRGSIYRAETFKEAFEAALAAAGVSKTLRPFHDLRHTAITNDAAAGSSAIAVMTKAGHSNMATTQRYLHLAGVVFREEADALERRLLAGTKLYPSEMTSDDPAEPEPSVQAAAAAR